MNGGRIFATVWLMGALSIPGWPQIRRIVYPLSPPQGGNFNPYLGQQQHNATPYPTPTPWRVNGSPVPATASPQSFLVVGPGGSPSWAPTPSPAATGYNGATPYPTPTSFAVNGSPVPATAAAGLGLVTGPGGTPTWTATPSPAATGYNGATPYPTPATPYPTPTAAPTSTPSLPILGCAPSTLISTGTIFAIAHYSVAVLTNDLRVVTAGAETCATPPTVALIDCGASAGTCSSPTTIASVQASGTSGTSVAASPFSTVTTAGDELRLIISAGGTCAVPPMVCAGAAG
jgi:hypothetical protein